MVAKQILHGPMCMGVFWGVFKQSNSKKISQAIEYKRFFEIGLIDAVPLNK